MGSGRTRTCASSSAPKLQASSGREHVITFEAYDAQGNRASCDAPVLVSGKTTAQFIRGDFNGDGELDLSDSVYVLNCQFRGGECSRCADSSDANDDGRSDISDAVYVWASSSRAPWRHLPRSPRAGIEGTDDALDFAFYAHCAE